MRMLVELEDLLAGWWGQAGGAAGGHKGMTHAISLIIGTSSTEPRQQGKEQGLQQYSTACAVRIALLLDGFPVPGP